MSRNRVEDFGPYQDGLKLFDHVVEDMEILRKDCRCYRLVGQQVGSADSICANMDEGFGRLSRTEFIRFLDISRGSARETLGRYKRLKHWLSKDTIAARVDIVDGIIARLTKSINTLRANNNTRNEPARRSPDGEGGTRSSMIHESHALYGTTVADRDTVSEKEIEELLRIGARDTRHATPDTL